MKAWDPILDNESEQTVRTSISDITTKLSAMEKSTLSPDELSEHALLYAYVGLENPSQDWHDESLSCLNLAVERFSLAVSATPPGLYGGLAGFGWMIQHVLSVLSGDDGSVPIEENAEDDPLFEVDKRILHLLTDGNAFGQNFDLISGYVGIGVYWLERLPRKDALLGIRLTLNALEALSENTPTGTTWFSPPSLVPPSQETFAPSGYYNLGVAHGVPGVIAFLAQVATLGLDVDITQKASALLKDSMNWLFSMERPRDAVSRFSSWVIPGQECGDSRLSWCYGDLGIASVVQFVAERTNNLAWQSEATSLMHRCTLRQLNTKVLDAPLCHGAFGNAHMFNRAYQAGHDVAYRDAAINWVHKGLTLREPGVGIAGYYRWRQDCLPYRQTDASFLSGVVGVALALLSTIAPIEPQWDRRMLLSGVKHIHN